MSTGSVPPAPKGWPVFDVRFADAIRRGFAGYVTFDGRASRAEFWYWYLFVVGGVLILVLPSVALGTATSSDGSLSPVGAVGLVIAGLFYAAVLLPTLAVACRRLHDAGFSGAFLLLVFVTGLIPLIMCMLPTSPSAVRFGPPGQPGYPGQPPLPPGYPSAYGQRPYGAPPAYGPPPGYGQPTPWGTPPGSGQPPTHGGPSAQPPGYGYGPAGPPQQRPTEPETRRD